MTSRQHSGIKLSTRNNNKTGQNPLGDGNTIAAREVSVWRYRLRAGCSACSANNSLCFKPKSPPTLDAWEHRHMIVATTCCARESVRVR
jgi:hypothetical protein